MFTLFRAEATSDLASFQAGPLSWSNWNLKCWFLWREENRRTRKKFKPSEQRENQQQIQPMYGTGSESHHCVIPAPQTAGGSR